MCACEKLHSWRELKLHFKCLWCYWEESICSATRCKLVEWLFSVQAYIPENVKWVGLGLTRPPVATPLTLCRSDTRPNSSPLPFWCWAVLEGEKKEKATLNLSLWSAQIAICFSIHPVSNISVQPHVTERISPPSVAVHLCRERSRVIIP